MNRDCRQSGMTLVELVVVLGLLAALATYALVSLDGLSDRSRVDTTRHRLDQIRQAIAGDGLTASRFVNDMGRLPNIPFVDIDGNSTFDEGQEFIELFSDSTGVGTVSGHSYTPTVSTESFTAVNIDLEYGWNGPYMETSYDALFDGFGNRFWVQTKDNNLYHAINAAETGIIGVASLGRDDTAGSGLDWADEDIELTDFGAVESVGLTVRTLVISRDAVDHPVWGSPVITTSVTSVTDGAFSEGQIYVAADDQVFRCKSNVTLISGTSPTWDTSVPGAETNVTDGSSNTVTWEYLGQKHQYMSQMKAVIFVPDPENIRDATADRIGELEKTVTGGTVTFDTTDGLSPGIRWLFVYGGLLGTGSTPPIANCYSSGVQCVELNPGENFLTVYLNQEL